MLNIKDIDANFKIGDIIPEDTVLTSVFEAPIKIEGLYNPVETRKYLRMPEKYISMETVNEGTRLLIEHTAGGRIRLATDSPYLIVSVELSAVVHASHMSVLGQSGVDIYIAEQGSAAYNYRRSVMPPELTKDSDRFYNGLIKFSDYDDKKSHEVMIHLPLYNGIKSFYIGVKNGSSIMAPVRYKYEKPVYFYGASITQGGCASRPGNNYPNHLSRWLNTDFVNLGFSGSACGEKEIAEYLARSDASAVVVDLDISINDIEIFRNTHYPFYKYIREVNKELPLIFISFPKYPKIHHDKTSRYRDHIISDMIIRETCMKAWRENDENVYYIDGETLFGVEDQDACTVDYCHPNDYGFYKMAEAIYPVLKKVLEKNVI